VCGDERKAALRSVKGSGMASDGVQLLPTPPLWKLLPGGGVSITMDTSEGAVKGSLVHLYIAVINNCNAKGINTGA
jgi:hypothetical protein